MRSEDRKSNELRSFTIETGILKNSDGSCLVKFGNTHVICSANLNDKCPPWLRGSGSGWLTAEYGMLPGSTNERMRRESVIGRQSGRTQEIQRLIGRSLRASIDLNKIGERQILIDCDVIQADGGTRTASVTGGWIAMKLCVDLMLKKKIIRINPIIEQVAAISCGIVSNNTLLDLDYNEDSNASTDANFVLTKSGKIIEIQSTAEGKTFSKEEFDSMFNFARNGIDEIIKFQSEILK